LEAAPLAELGSFPLLDALFGRRARRFGLGMSIPNGPLAYESAYEPIPLTDTERFVLVLAGVGLGGWNFGIPHTTSGNPELGCNYPNRLIGRTYPSGAGVHASELLVSDDSGSYITQFRNLDPERLREYGAAVDLERLAEVLAPYIVRLDDKRVEIPAEAPHLFGHNNWVTNKPGTTMFYPVVDVTEHVFTVLAILAGEGYVIYDHRADRPFGSPDELLAAGVLDLTLPFPLEDLERLLLASAVAEGSFMAYNIVLLLQAMGLGGWLYNGINGLTILGASADQGVPGFGFRFHTDERWTTSNPVGLDGYFEALTPPYHADLRAAARTYAERKFGPGGTFDPSRPGPFRENERVKAAVERYSDELIEYVGSVAQDVHDTYGKFPGTVPTIWTGIYAQAHHIDVEFYDRHYDDGAYLRTHRDHFERWHAGVHPTRREDARQAVGVSS
jgi:hypothetical protein